MPDVIEVLEQDHRLVERLFEQYEQGNEPEVAERICDEMTVHSEAEEQLVYPVLGRDVPDGSELEQEARDEHAEVKSLIERVRRAGFAGEEVAAMMQAMKDAIEHHVEEEESEIFPKMRASVDEQRLGELGEQVDEFKQRAAQSSGSGGDNGAGADGRGKGGSSGRSRSSSRGGNDEPTKQELYEQARAEGIEGRSTMSKEELAKAVERH